MRQKKKRLLELYECRVVPYKYTTTTTWINIDGYLFTTGNIKLSAGQCLGPDETVRDESC
jgi:hypothetical protein